MADKKRITKIINKFNQSTPEITRKTQVLGGAAIRAAIDSIRNKWEWDIAKKGRKNYTAKQMERRRNVWNIINRQRFTYADLKKINYELKNGGTGAGRLLRKDASIFTVEKRRNLREYYLDKNMAKAMKQKTYMKDGKRLYWDVGGDKRTIGELVNEGLIWTKVLPTGVTLLYNGSELIGTIGYTPDAISHKTK